VETGLQLLVFLCVCPVALNGQEARLEVALSEVAGVYNERVANTL
jgi:hypothetical protein